MVLRHTALGRIVPSEDGVHDQTIQNIVHSRRARAGDGLMLRFRHAVPVALLTAGAKSMKYSPCDSWSSAGERIAEKVKTRLGICSAPVVTVAVHNPGFHRMQPQSKGPAVPPDPS